MKKSFFVIIALALLLVSLCSCGIKKEEKKRVDTLPEHNDKFLYQNFDESFVRAFIDEFFESKRVRCDESLDNASFKMAVIGNSEKIQPEVARAAVENVIISILKENPYYYNVQIDKTENSVDIKILYTLQEIYKPAP